jgi:hypothetical protein
LAELIMLMPVIVAKGDLRQSREENGKLKRLVAHLSLGHHILQEIAQKKL